MVVWKNEKEWAQTHFPQVQQHSSIVQNKSELNLLRGLLIQVFELRNILPVQLCWELFGG